MFKFHLLQSLGVEQKRSFSLWCFYRGCMGVWKVLSVFCLLFFSISSCSPLIQHGPNHSTANIKVEDSWDSSYFQHIKHYFHPYFQTMEEEEGASGLQKLKFLTRKEACILLSIVESVQVCSPVLSPRDSNEYKVRMGWDKLPWPVKLALGLLHTRVMLIVPSILVNPAFYS